MQRTRRFLLGALPALFVVGCLSPTLPLPPPEAPDVEQVGQGQYRLTGRIPFPGTVFVVNTRTALIFGKIAQADYEFDITAEGGDLMTIWYESGGDPSDSAQFRIPRGNSLPAPDGGTP